MELQRIVAHTPNAQGKWDGFLEHIGGVASRARAFAESFGGGDVAGLLGLWHDLGKINPEFQDYLRAIASGAKPPKGPPHAIWGAALVYARLAKLWPDQWEVLALPIAGHHAGLGERSQVTQKLSDFVANNSDALAMMADACSLPELKPRLQWTRRTEALSKEFFVRMVFSVLVDADFLATEGHFNSEVGSLRSNWPSVGTLWERFQLSPAPKSNASELVNRIRDEVYSSCIDAAGAEPGFFRLTVPTGGGKTRSGLVLSCINKRTSVKSGNAKILGGSKGFG